MYDTKLQVKYSSATGEIEQLCGKWVDCYRPFCFYPKHVPIWYYLIYVKTNLDLLCLLIKDFFYSLYFYIYSYIVD